MINATSVVAAASSGFARHLSTSEVALEVARGAAAGAFDAKQPDYASINLEHPGILHNRHAANDGRTRCWLGVSGCGGGQPCDPRLRANGLRPRGGGLHHEFVPDARRQIAAGNAPGRRVVVVADPHSHDDVVGEPDEPCVLVILASPGLALDRSVDPCRATRTLANHAGEELGH